MPEAVQCRRCYHLRNDWCKIKRDSPDPELVRTCPYYHEATNADRIRAMSDEELASYLMLGELTTLRKLGCFPKPKEIDQAMSEWLDWLQSPAGGGDKNG